MLEFVCCLWWVLQKFWLSDNLKILNNEKNGRRAHMESRNFPELRLLNWKSGAAKIMTEDRAA